MDFETRGKGNIILRKTLIIYHHVMNLSDSLAHKVIIEQRRLGIEGLSSQGNKYLAELGLRETLLTCTTKTQFKQILDEKITVKNKQDILTMCKGYTKVKYFEMKEEDFGLHESCKTLTLTESRNLFAIKYCMHKSSKLNFASDPVFSKQLYLCDCGEISSNLHFRYCRKYEFLRIGKDLSSDKMLVRYFEDINKLCDKIETNL